VRVLCRNPSRVVTPVSGRHPGALFVPSPTAGLRPDPRGWLTSTQECGPPGRGPYLSVGHGVVGTASHSRRGKQAVVAQQCQSDGVAGDAAEEHEMPGELARRHRIQVGGDLAAGIGDVVEVECLSRRREQQPDQTRTVASADAWGHHRAQATAMGHHHGTTTVCASLESSGCAQQQLSMFNGPQAVPRPPG
jgi:hypothetical protein